MIRLDKYLADMGVGTRTEVKRLIRQGKVRVDGAVEKSADKKVDECRSLVKVGEKEISYVRYEYYMLNKPAGVVSATDDRRDRTVLDLIEGRKRKDLFPVGRLDKDTEGLLLITNDGKLAHLLLSPKRHVDKTYEARIQGQVTREHVKAFQEGLDIGEERLTLSAVLEILNSGEISQVRVTIQEGKFHQIKRMFQAVGCEVLYLKRLSMGSLTLDESLKPGEYRFLTEAELAKLKLEVGVEG